MMQILIALPLFCPFATPTPVQDGAPLIFHGRVWVIEDGVRRAAQSGLMHLNAEVDWTWRDAYDVDVKDGRFRQIVRLEHERYWVGKMQLEGREALCTWHAPRAVLSDAIELEARFLPISRVRVRLRDSGEVLSSCEMDADHLTAKPRSMELPQLVSPWRADEYDAPWQLRRTIRARAPGTAWGTAVVDLEAGGDFWIDLVPEAKLRVSVFVPPDVPQQQLRLVSDGGEMESDWNNLTHDGQLIAFDGLAEGSYAVETRSRHSDWAKQAQRAEIHLCENETRELLLDLDCLAAVPRALVRGSLTVDASWPKPAEPVQLSFLRKDPSTGRHALELRVEAVQDDSGTLAWDAGRLRLGRYAVVVEPYGCVSDLDLVVGLEPAALQVPPRWTYRLRFIDARTRKAIDVDSMTWCSAALCGAADLGERHALDTKDGPDFEFDAPRGRLRVVPNAVGYCDTAFAIAPHRGEWLSEYALEPDCTIRVRLIDGARAIDPPSSDVLRIVRVKGAGILPKRSLRDGVVQVRFEEAGAYAISAKSFAGFAASEAVVVEARLGEVVDVTLNVSARVEAH